MASYTPTIITDSTPAIEISMAGNITYSEFMGTLGVDVYLVKKIFAQANSFQQISQTVKYSIYDSNGFLFSESVALTPDLYQFRPALVLSEPGFGMVLNGRSTYNFNIFSGERVQVIFYAEALELDNGLDKVSKSNTQIAKENDNIGQLELYDYFKDNL